MVYMSHYIRGLYQFGFSATVSCSLQIKGETWVCGELLKIKNHNQSETS